MKAYKYFFTVSAITLTTFVLSSFSLQASNNIEDEIGSFTNRSVRYEKLKEELERNYEKYNTILNSSKDKNIICFLGQTGSGKSTLINYLARGKEWLTFENDDVILSEEGKKALEEGRENLTPMEIGIYDKSKTFHPKSIAIEYKSKNMLLYDFPGFGDTGASEEELKKGPLMMEVLTGAEKDLLNACFIKNILEKAKGVGTVFVAGKGEIEDGRGYYLQNKIKMAGNLMKESSVEDLSSLVITKVDSTKLAYSTIEAMGVRIRDKCGNHKVLNEWINKGRLARMLCPQKEITEDERDEIFTAISKINYAKIPTFCPDTIEGIGDTMNTLYSFAFNKHSNQAKQKQSTDNANIDETTFCFFFKLSDSERDHTKKLASFLRHAEELENDELIKYLKELQPSRYEKEVNGILDAYIPSETRKWTAKMIEQYGKDINKGCCKCNLLNKKQVAILFKYLTPTILKDNLELQKKLGEQFKKVMEKQHKVKMEGTIFLKEVSSLTTENIESILNEASLFSEK
jgi:ribosome biogenesis GTPase A